MTLMSAIKIVRNNTNFRRSWAAAERVITSNSTEWPSAPVRTFTRLSTAMAGRPGWGRAAESNGFVAFTPPVPLPTSARRRQVFEYVPGWRPKPVHCLLDDWMSCFETAEYLLKGSTHTQMSPKECRQLSSLKSSVPRRSTALKVPCFCSEKNRFAGNIKR